MKKSDIKRYRINLFFVPKMALSTTLSLSVFIANSKEETKSNESINAFQAIIDGLIN